MVEDWAKTEMKTGIMVKIMGIKQKANIPTFQSHHSIIPVFHIPHSLLEKTIDGGRVFRSDLFV
jgi:hypothetical protein